MSGQDAALPRVRARRKRVKPPPPSFWRALAWVVWDLFLIGADLFFVGGAIGAVLAAIVAVVLTLIDWPAFRRELTAWKRDQ